MNDHKFGSNRDRPLIVGIGGTTRIGSSSERALRYALRAAEHEGADTLVLGAADIDLPMYNPETRERSSVAQRLVTALGQADGVIVSSPAYHGAVSGLVKNAMDYVEDLRNDVKPYLDGRAMGCITTAAGWQASAAALGQLRAIAHALRAWPTPLGVAMNSAERCFSTEGDPTPLYSDQLSILARHVVWFARTQRLVAEAIS